MQGSDKAKDQLQFQMAREIWDKRPFLCYLKMSDPEMPLYVLVIHLLVIETFDFFLSCDTWYQLHLEKKG